MISLALRKAGHGHRALRLQQHGRFAVLISTRSYRSCLSISKQSYILRPLAITNTDRSWYVPRTHHIAYNISTEAGDDVEKKRLPLLINMDEQLDEVYASPVTFVSQNNFSVLKRDCKTMRVTNKDGNDEVWYTATYTTERKLKGGKLGIVEHDSGKFTSFIQERIDPNNTWGSDKTLIVDGKVYYKDQNIAFESAAARMLDTIAFRVRYGSSNRRRIDAHLATKTEPIRYCVEEPSLFDLDNRYLCSHAPTYYLKILLQDIYGPIDDIQYDVDVHSEFDDWYTATFIEPVTKETFNSGVFGLGMRGNSKLPEVPRTPLPLEQIIIHDGRVYYRDESVAKHAAAAKAIDCLNFRSKNDQHNQLCLDNPYLLEDKDRIIPANYEELRKIIDERRQGKPGFSWSDFVASQDRSILRLNKNVLSNGITAQYGSLGSKKGITGSHGKLYQVTSFENEERIWYTSSYFDPITKERFASGIVQAQYSLSYYENVECKVFDGKVYYNNEILAVDSSAARALDCYLFRENKNTGPFCLEDPYMTIEEGKAQSIDYDALVNQWNTQLAAIEETALASFDPKGEKSHISSSQETQSAEGSHIGRVLSSLPSFYRHVPKSMLETGIYKLSKTHTTLSSTYDIQTTSFEGRDWFTATVQTPISNERFVSGIGRLVSTKKKPSASLKVPLHEAETKIIDGKVYYTTSKLAEHAAAATAIDCYMFRYNPTSIYDRLCVEEPYMNLLDAERPPPTEANESTLELEPANNKPDLRPSTTMGRIAEIWTDTSGLDAVVSRQPDPGINIESILNWYKQAYKEPQSPDEAMVMAQLLNKVLTALGEAQRRESSYINVEKEARSIRDKIISLSITFDGIVVDASMFNSYINCLNRFGFDSKSSALFAKDLLMKMQRQETFNGIILPLPTIETYNAVMRICTFVDKAHVNGVYKLLSEEGNGYHLSPNKDTVKILLAANSTVNTRFCFDSALSCLSQTQQTFGIVLDADIYSAALGSLPQSLLEHDSPYESGFKEHDEKSNREASDIAKWILYAEQNGVKPNAEMYEHIIHSCTKIGTKEGLLTAEDWAGRAIASGSAIRLSTFEPIITAWSLCGIPKRVEQWITQLDGLSGSNINLQPDLGTHSLYLKALRNVQASIIDRVEGSDNSDEERAECVKQAFMHAKLCTKYLNEMLLTSMHKLDTQQDVDAMSSMFETTLEACGCASRLSLESPTTLSDDGSHNTAMLDVASLIKIDDDQDDELSHKILEIMGEAYVETISQLHQTASVASSVDVIDNGASCFPLLDVDKLIRDYDDYSQKIFGDARDIDLRLRLYEEVLTGCSGGIKSSDAEHIIRIIKVICEQITYLNSKTAKNSRETVELTDLFSTMVLLTKTAVEAPQDRTVVLTEIWDKSKPFFYRRIGGSGLGNIYRARIIGSIRTALDDTDSDVIEDFLSTFEQKREKKNGWLGAPFHYYN